MNIHKASALVGISLVLAGGCVHASSRPEVSAVTGTGQINTVHVNYADVDLNKAAGQESLRRRVELAAERVCGVRPDLRGLADMSTWNHCRDTAVEEAIETVNSRVAALTVSSR